MPHLWIQDEDADWAVQPLNGEAVALGPGGARTARRSSPTALPASSAKGAGDTTALLMPASTRDGAVWVMVTPPGVEARVNGIPLTSGLRVLADRDEIRVATGVAVFFSMEQLAAVVPFPGVGEGRSARCPRCQQDIEKSAPSVCCPQCRLSYHQSGPRLCWTYREVCAMCDQATDLGVWFRWSPADL